MLYTYANFFPKLLEGGARYLDCWNSDLYWDETDLRLACAENAIPFKADLQSYSPKFSVGGPNGLIQAYFKWDLTSHLVVAMKLSSSRAYVRAMLDNTEMGTFTVTSTGQVHTFTAFVYPGLHSVTLFQVHPAGSSAPQTLWFHSLKCYQLSGGC